MRNTPNPRLPNWCLEYRGSPWEPVGLRRFASEGKTVCGRFFDRLREEPKATGVAKRQVKWGTKLSTSRVLAGSMRPSSYRRAVA
jgi:hypothetical protein